MEIGTKRCMLCCRSVSISDTVTLNAIFDIDPYRTVADAILDFVNVEFGLLISEDVRFVCISVCYQRLKESIEFQDLIKNVFKRLNESVHEPLPDGYDTQEVWLETPHQLKSTEISGDCDEKSASDMLLSETADTFDVKTISSEPELTSQTEEKEEAGSLFVLPETELISMHMQFEHFEYIELNGHRCCSCALIAKTIEELSKHADVAHLSGHSEGRPAADRPYECSICSAGFESELMLNSHKQNQTNAVFLCKCCGLAFNTKQHLMKHRMQATFADEQDASILDESRIMEEVTNDDYIVEQLHSEVTCKNGGSRKETLLEEKLITHVDDYHDYRILHTDGERCCSCGKFFANYDEMLAHATAVHVQPETHSDCTCPACGETFKSKKCLKHHQGTNSSFKKIFFCKLCKVSFVRVHLLARHLLASYYHRSNGTENILEHIHEEHVGAILRQQSQLNSSKISGFGCCFVRCDATFDDETQLQNHVEELHAVRRQINITERTSDEHVCNVCQLNFTKEQNLQRHRYSWQMRKVNICSYCGKGFPNPSILWEHERVEHTDPQPRFECEHCGKLFKKKSLIKLHLVTHQTYRKFGCYQCGARFHFGHQLKKHQNSVHATELPYQCTHCQRKMPNKERYDQHMRKHTGERPYECRHGCGRTFSHTTDRRRHEMATHTGEKPHQCLTCEMAYIRKRDLQMHLQKYPDHTVGTVAYQLDQGIGNGCKTEELILDSV